MSAAHELVERGFSVRVFEKKPDVPGGKARSVPVPYSATDGREPLPGEHGFRFFPGFYRHVTDTMRRIPFGGNANGVFDNLVPTDRITLARTGHAPVVTPAHFPHSLGDLQTLIHALTDAHTGLSGEEKEFFANRVWQLMTSCKERRVGDYERIGWWTYTAADRFSEAYRSLFVKGLTRTLVAAKANEASTKTGGDILLQLLFNMANPSVTTDRVLNGPTNEVWIDPWLTHLRAQGVEYRFGATVERIDCATATPGTSLINGVHVRHADGTAEHVVADYYVAAVPVEQMAPLLTSELLAADPVLAGICPLAADVAWMTGIQYYLRSELVVARGHVIYSDTPWALTSISQLPFWTGFDISAYGNGEVRTVLSVDISDWDEPGLNGKAARDCTRTEIHDEVFAQLQQALAGDPEVVLDRDDIVDWFLDRDIAYDSDALPIPPPDRNGGCSPIAAARSVEGADFHTINEEPLLVNKVATWALRPDATTAIPNFFLASDYVRTNTDLATMEGANEAARRAVNGIVLAAGADVPLCEIWDLNEPFLLKPFRWVDQHRYRKGLPWTNEFPLLLRLLHRLLVWRHRRSATPAGTP